MRSRPKLFPALFALFSLLTLPHVGNALILDAPLSPYLDEDGPARPKLPEHPRVRVLFTDDGIEFRFRHERAVEAYVEGSFNNRESDRWEMNRKGADWIYTTRLPDGDYNFRVLYRLDNDSDLVEGKKIGAHVGYSKTDLINLILDDQSIRLYDPSKRGEVQTRLDADYNRVQGFDLSYTIGVQHLSRRSPRFHWTQGYSWGLERWSWRAGAEVPIRPRSGLEFLVEGLEQTVSHDTWSIETEENIAAALFLKEDFFDYVWQSGWSAGLQKRGRGHTFRVAYRETDTSPLTRTVDWALLSKDKKFRPNLFSGDSLVAGNTRQIETSIEWDRRNRTNRPTAGWFIRLDGEYAGEELGGDYDYKRSVGRFSHYFKLTDDTQFDMRVMGGGIDGTAPLYRMFRIGGVGTLRAHDFKELTGNRFVVANIEYRVRLFSSFQVAFFTDIGDAWDTEERRHIDLESDMGIGLADDDGDVRINLARRLNQGADDDLVVTFRMNRMF